jgi:TolB-like protein/class 3 adenylate cyclase
MSALQGNPRRLAAILAVDVAGYSRLMGADEAGTARAVREHREAARPVVRAHGGRIVKTMGDGVLLEFPSVVAAAECAVAMQRLMVERNADVPEARRIVYRIGLHLGDVLIEGDDIVGDGVNIAARLEGIAEPGGICLSAIAYESVRGKIDADFTDLGEKELKNIARPVRVYAIAPDFSLSRRKPGPIVVEDSPEASMDPGFRRGGDKRKAAESEKNSPPRLSIVVLPFANLGGDPEQEYFVDGVTESLTTDLSRISGSFVIARNTAFTYKGKPVDVKQVGRELNVRYVLEGSVQRGGNRLRVNVQLIDAGSGAHLWAERFDKPIADLFDMQDEIVAHLANQLNAQLIAAEARRIESISAGQLSSIELTLRARSLAQQSSLQSLRAARPLYEAALRLDERNVDALVGLAGGLIAELESWASPDRDGVLAAAEAAIMNALAISPDHARAHYVRARLFQVQRKPVEQLREHELVIQFDRNFALAHVGMGFAKVFLGRSQEAEAHIAEAIRLSPRDPNRSVFFFAVGAADLYLGRCERAADWCRKAIEANPIYELPYFYLAAALALAGRQDEAEAAASAAMRLHPHFRIAKFRAEAFGDSPIYLAQRERLYEGMRKAGVPEG